MKLSKNFIALGTLALVLSGASGLLIANKTAHNNEQVAKADSEYTIYRCDDLGFATRDPGDTRIVKGDCDGGMQTKGNVLAEKSEIKVAFKQTTANWWFGVGGYAVYMSNGTSVRFLNLTYNSSGAYSRNAVKSGLLMKTADGSTDLLSVISGGGYFSDYVNATLRTDLSNASAPKLEFYVEYNGVTYYPFEGSTKIGEYTYSAPTLAAGFAAEDQHRAMAGVNASASGVSVLKFQSHVKSLDNIITAGDCNFHYSYIDNFFFSFKLSEQIFADTMYFNDHAGIDRFKDANGNFIDILNGIIINGQTFGYWKSFDASSAVFPRNDGVTAFPMSVGGDFSPVSIEATATSLEFKTVVEYIPMDGMEITFKAGIFEGYYNGVTYVLNNDLTFYSTIKTSGAPARVQLTKEKIWEDTRLGIKSVDDWGEQTASQGGKFHRYAMWTNIPRDVNNIIQGCPADNYRYMYDNILLNGLTLSHYHAWARGNSKDFTDLNDVSTQNPDYELGHPTGSANTRYDLAIRVVIVTDQPNYVLFLDVPDQLVIDLSLGSLTFTLRDGSDWLSLKNGVSTIARYDATGNAEDISVLENFLETKLHMNDYTDNLGYCNDNEHHYYLTAKEAYNALSETQKIAFQNNAQFARARERFEAWATFNNDAAPYDGNNSVTTTINAGVVNLLNSDSNDIVIIVVLSAILTSVIAVSALFVFRKRKAQ